MRRAVVGIVLATVLLANGVFTAGYASPDGTAATAWNSWTQRRPVSLRFHQERIVDVVTGVLQQSDVLLSPSVSPCLEGKTVTGSICSAAFWPAMTEIAQLANAEIAVRREVNGRTLLCLDTHSSQTPTFRQYSFVGPLCFELSRLGAAASPEAIGNTWRVRSLGLPEDGEACVCKVAITDHRTKQVTDCDLLRVSDNRGDIVRTIGGGTYDYFFKPPKQTEQNGFSCKISISMTEVSEWTWVELPLQEGAEVCARHVRIQVQKVSEKDGDILVSYRMGWSPGIGEDAIAKLKKLRARLQADATLTAEETKWMNENRIAVMAVRDSAVTTRHRGRRVLPVSLRRKSSAILEKPELFGEISIPKTPGVGNVTDYVLRLQIANERFAEQELLFAVPPSDMLQSGTAPKQ